MSEQGGEDYFYLISTIQHGFSVGGEIVAQVSRLFGRGWIDEKEAVGKVGSSQGHVEDNMR